MWHKGIFFKRWVSLKSVQVPHRLVGRESRGDIEERDNGTQGTFHGTGLSTERTGTRLVFTAAEHK